MRILILLAALSAAALGQLTRASISGIVYDASGAVAPGVEVTAREQATGIKHRAKTNEAGIYRVAALEPGSYSLEFAKAGFDTRTVEGIVLGSSQDAVLNHSLAVAGSATTVTVDGTAAGVTLSKASPSIERHLDGRTVETLPLTGLREVEDLAILSPAVADLGVRERGFVFSAAGQRDGHNISTINGLDNSDPQFQYIGAPTTPETASEVHVRLNPYSAEFGRGLGAQISVITRSGTNAFHGDAWEYYSANSLSAATLANKRAGVGDSRSIDHQAGGALGGPVLKNRSFFFGSFQASPHREGPSANGVVPVTIPTPTGWAALSRVPLATGQSAESRRAALDAIGFLPEIHTQVRRYDAITNIPVNGVQIEVGTTSIPIARKGDYYRWQARLDHRFSERDTVTYFRNGIAGEAPYARDWPFSNNQFGTRFAARENSGSRNDALTHTHIFGPSVVNEARVSAARRYAEVEAPADAGVRTNVGLFRLGPHDFNPFDRPSKTYEAQDVMTWMQGRHSIKFGAHLLAVHDTVSSTKQSQWMFANLAAFVNSLPTTLQVRVNPASVLLRSLKQNYFAQDDFKVTDELTLNVGVRYQTASIPRLLRANAPELAATGMPRTVRRDPNDLAPRFGFAWSPRAASGRIGQLLGNGLTVFRGGFGIAHGVAYEGEIGGNVLGIAGNYPYNTVLPLDANQLVNRYPNIPPFANTASFNPASAAVGYAADSQNPTMHFYSLSVQRQAARNVVVEFGYTGNRSYHLKRSREENYAVLTEAQARDSIAGRPIPGVNQRRLNAAWGSRLIQEMSAGSKYHAGYAKVDRRFARGFLLGASYTYSGAWGETNPDRPQDNRWYGPEYGRLNSDRPQRLVIHYAWQTPGRRFWAGWRLAGYTQWQSGQPFTVTTGVDSNGDGYPQTDRPDYNASGALRLDPVTGDWRSFSTPTDGRGSFVTPVNTAGLPLPFTVPNGGNLGVNTFRSPASATWNVTLMKPFRVAERWGLELRADWTNVMNHRNFGPPVAIMNLANYGANVSAPPSRVTLISAKLRF